MRLLGLFPYLTIEPVKLSLKEKGIAVSGFQTRLVE